MGLNPFFNLLKYLWQIFLLWALWQWEFVLLGPTGSQMLPESGVLTHSPLIPNQLP